MPVLKRATLEISNLREVFEKQEVKQAVDKNTLFGRLGEIEGLTSLMEGVFKEVMKDPELSLSYEGKNLEVLKQKYAYYIAGQMGGPMVGRQDIEDIHIEANQSFADEPQRLVTHSKFAKMSSIFKSAFDKHPELTPQDRLDLNEFIEKFKLLVCVQQGDTGFDTLDQIKNNALYT